MKKIFITLSVIVAGVAVYLSRNKKTPNKKSEKEKTSHVMADVKINNEDNKNELANKVADNESKFEDVETRKKAAQDEMVNRHLEASSIIRDSMKVILDEEDDLSDDLDQISDDFDKLLGDE